MSEREVSIKGRAVHVRAGRRTVACAPLASFVKSLAGAWGHRSELLPAGTRLVIERRDALGLAVELLPQARTVRWIEDGSRAPFGKGALYRERFLSFPYMIVLLVLRGGALTGVQQLFYRTAPLERASDPLLLPNLPNVARAYGLRCWLCLAGMSPPPAAGVAATVRAVLDHLFSASFNRSSDVHEFHSYWAEMRVVDPRVASLDAWEQATRDNRLFAGHVRWRAAGTTIGGELEAMLDRVVAPFSPGSSAEDVEALVHQAGAGEGWE